jgi:hypothetical protein
MLSAYHSAILSRVKYSDTSSMLTAYQSGINSKANLAGGNTFTGTQVFSNASTFDGLATFDEGMFKLLGTTGAGYALQDVDGDGVGEWGPINIPIPDGDYGDIEVNGPSWDITDAAKNMLAILSQELKSKTINADSNTITNLTLSNFKSGETEELDETIEEVKNLRNIGFNAIHRTIAATWQASTTANDLVDNTIRYAALSAINKDTVITGVKYNLITAGVFTGDQTNAIALYSLNTSTGLLTKVAETSNSTSIWTGSTGFRSAAFSSPYSATEGEKLYVACLYNQSAQTTGPALVGPAESGNRSFALDMSNSIKVYGHSLGNSLPSTINCSALSTSNRTYLFFTY